MSALPVLKGNAMPISERIMNRLREPPERLRAAPAKGTETNSPVDREGGEHGAGLIRGIAVVTRGEALTHGYWLDNEFLKQTADAIKASKTGIKSRFTHPGLSSDGLGKYLGRIHNGRVDGNVVRGDLHFSPMAHETPDGDLADYVMGLAESDPKAFATSIVFRFDRKAEAEFHAKNVDKDGVFKSPDKDNVKNYPHVRLQSLHADDIVDEPAANPDGLFHSGDEIAKEAHDLVSYALGLSEEKPDVALLDIDPDRVAGFVANFMARHGLEVTMAKENEKPVETVSNGPDLSAIRLSSLKDKYGKDPGFVLEMFEAGKSAQDAEIEWLRRESKKSAEALAQLKAENDKLKADAEKAAAEAAKLAQKPADKPAAPIPGAEPVKFGAPDGTQAPAGDFLAQARALSAERKIPLYRAMSELASEKPELYEAYAAAQQPRKPSGANATGLPYDGFRRR